MANLPEFQTTNTDIENPYEIMDPTETNESQENPGNSSETQEIQDNETDSKIQSDFKIETQTKESAANGTEIRAQNCCRPAFFLIRYIPIIHCCEPIKKYFSGLMDVFTAKTEPPASIPSNCRLTKHYEGLHRVVRLECQTIVRRKIT